MPLVYARRRFRPVSLGKTAHCFADTCAQATGVFDLLAVGHRELQQAWSKDSFIKSGGTAKSSKRRSENFSELFAACHAAEDRLKDLTLKHGRAVKTAAPKTRQQQENIVPTAKRRDALRYAHMQGNHRANETWQTR